MTRVYIVVSKDFDFCWNPADIIEEVFSSKEDAIKYAEANTEISGYYIIGKKVK